MFPERVSSLSYFFFIFFWFAFLYARNILPLFKIFFFLSFYSYLNAIQICCPHIFRYIGAAVITNKKRQYLMKDFVRVIKHVTDYVYQVDLRECK